MGFHRPRPAAALDVPRTDMFSAARRTAYGALVAGSAAGAAGAVFGGGALAQCAVARAPARPLPLEPEEVDDEDEKCGFCRYMKGGPCRQVFVVWEQCVLAAKEDGGDFIEKCQRPTLALRECTDARYEYYAEFSADSPTARVKPEKARGGAEGGREADSPDADAAPTEEGAEPAE